MGTRPQQVQPRYRMLTTQDNRVQVAVIGGGITGLCTALRLSESGKRVMLVEALTVGSGTTGSSTCKATSLHRLVYAELRRMYGPESAKTYASMNEYGVNAIEELVRKYNIDCDWHRVPNYTYTLEDKKIKDVEKEVEAAKEAGLNAVFTTETELPFPVKAAIMVPGQGSFNAYKFCLGLSRVLAEKGVPIHESTRVTNVSFNTPHTVECATGGTIIADEVVLATHLPILDRSFHFSMVEPVCSYGLALPLRNAWNQPRGMYISAEEPTRSIRFTIEADGKEYLIVSGNGHKLAEAEGEDAWAKYEELEAWARSHWDCEPASHRWFAFDYKPPDLLPFVGHITKGSNTIFTATGFKKWGLAFGVASAQVLTDLINKTGNPWADLVSGERWNLRKSLLPMLKIQAHVGKRFVGDRLREFGAKDVDTLAEGHGGVVKIKGKTCGAYKDAQGLHAVELTCAHLGCHVRFNDTEATWDCPCHGSRYDAVDGSVIHGPSVKGLTKCTAMEW
jgi:glycine/D-amino acid oxidase-like deaminating enzyme/nitrite reductase/ring-hydroxylating ferredoxin subunit